MADLLKITGPRQGVLSRPAFRLRRSIRKKAIPGHAAYCLKEIPDFYLKIIK
jgi:hypothetical protein